MIAQLSKSKMYNFRMLNMSSRIVNENILHGFWEHFSNHVKKTTPLIGLNSIYYAGLGLNASIVKFLDTEPSDVENYEKWAAEALGYVVHLNELKKWSCIVNYGYDIPTRQAGPSVSDLYQSLRRVTVATMCHISNGGELPDMELFRCEPRVSGYMRHGLEMILQVIASYTGRTLRELAIIHQKKHDLLNYAHENLNGIGLNHLPLERI